MEAVRRLTPRFHVAVPVLLLATGVGVGTQTPPAFSDSGSNKIPIRKHDYSRFGSVAEESLSSQEPSRGSSWSSRRLPEIVKAGDPVLHERASEVDHSDIKSQRVQTIIDDMIRVMRGAPAISLSAPQIGIPLRIIVLEFKKELVSLHTPEDIDIMEKRPFDLLVIVNPELKKESRETVMAFEACVSVDGHAAVVERNLDVEVTGFDRYGKPIKINASGWQARVLQHECDHLDGTLYVEKMVPKTFKAGKNYTMPLVHWCPKLGPQGNEFFGVGKWFGGVDMGLGDIFEKMR